MGRAISRTLLVILLVGAGWALGRAQVRQPEFELRVDAPAGETRVECVRGCELMWVERGVNPNDSPQSSFSFACRGQVERCSSARIGGWTK
jgi:hypothetical protein